MKIHNEFSRREKPQRTRLLTDLLKQAKEALMPKKSKRAKLPELISTAISKAYAPQGKPTKSDTSINLKTPK